MSFSRAALDLPQNAQRLSGFLCTWSQNAEKRVLIPNAAYLVGLEFKEYKCGEVRPSFLPVPARTARRTQTWNWERFGSHGIQPCSESLAECFPRYPEKHLFTTRPYKLPFPPGSPRKRCKFVLCTSYFVHGPVQRLDRSIVCPSLARHARFTSR